MFLPYIQNANNGVNQNALAGLLKSQYQRGLQGWGGSLSQEAGLRGLLGNQSVQQAFQQAMGLAGQRASVWSGTPPMTQPNYNLANGIGNAANLGLTAYGIYKNNQQPRYTANYDTSGSPGTVPGSTPPPTWGLPSNEEPPLY